MLSMGKLNGCAHGGPDLESRSCREKGRGLNPDASLRPVNHVVQRAANPDAGAVCAFCNGFQWFLTDKVSDVRQQGFTRPRRWCPPERRRSGLEPLSGFGPW